MIHTAGNTSCNNRPAGADESSGGTRHVGGAALANGVTVVYTSTTSTIGANHGAAALSEDTPWTFRARSPYALTKLRAQDIVLSAHARGLRA